MPLFEKWMDKLKQQPEEEEEMNYEDFYSDEEETAGGEPEQPAEEQAQPSAEAEDHTGSREIHIQDGDKMHIVLFRPETFDKDVTAMADQFIQRNTLLLNMEQTNKDIAKRIIDFLGGVAYAHSGKVSRVAEDTYIVMPSNVELSGADLMDEVESDNVYF